MSLNDKATFEYMSEGDEEAEHSIEMQMPFIAKVIFCQVARHNWKYLRLWDENLPEVLQLFPF